MKNLVIATILIGLFLSCSNKKKEKIDTSRYFPILNYLQSQVKFFDTTRLPVWKVETVNGISDTMPISREDAKKFAAEFVNIPDITLPEHGSDYSEVANYDTLMERAFMSYTAHAEDAEVVRQDVTIQPNFSGGEDKVKTIYIEKLLDEGDSLVNKKMLWQMDQFFTITTIVQKPNSPEKIHRLKISWQTPATAK